MNRFCTIFSLLLLGFWGCARAETPPVEDSHVVVNELMNRSMSGKSELNGVPIMSVANVSRCATKISSMAAWAPVD